jgi:hypothetical protein
MGGGDADGAVIAEQAAVALSITSCMQVSRSS